MTTDNLSLFINNIELKEIPEKGLSVIACRSFKNGDKIETIEGNEVPERNIYTLQVHNKHIEINGFLRYVNHSCEPNAHFTNYDLIAHQAIKHGEEITIDYHHTETKISQPFHCECGASKCRGWIA